MKYSKITLLAMAGAISLSLTACVPTTVKEGWTGKNGYPQWHPQTGENPLSSVGTQCFFCGNAEVAKAPPVEAPKAIPAPAPAPAPIDGDDDQDGVLNSKDKCPNTPRGAKVNDLGCWVLENLNFDTDKAVIKPAAFPLLDGVVTVLKQNPSLRVEVQGHTDNTGKPPHNDKLSKARAEAVKKHLISKGIAANRLTSAGFGATKPIAPNDNPAGRAKNRRVELKPQS
ncbi:MAG: OmpA family protein [Magnetococcales bacterium]|nr:OmpA family protein [Magnetococcales bacterium]